MEKKIKPHTMQTFQAVVCKCDLFAGRSGCSGKRWQLHRWVSDTRCEPRRGERVVGCRAVLVDSGGRQRKEQHRSLFMQWLLKSTARRESSVQAWLHHHWCRAVLLTQLKRIGKGDAKKKGS